MTEGGETTEGVGGGRRGRSASATTVGRRGTSGAIARSRGRSVGLAGAGVEGAEGGTFSPFPYTRATRASSSAWLTLGPL